MSADLLSSAFASFLGHRRAAAPPPPLHHPAALPLPPPPPYYTPTAAPPAPLPCYAAAPPSLSSPVTAPYASPAHPSSPAAALPTSPVAPSPRPHQPCYTVARSVAATLPPLSLPAAPLKRMRCASSFDAQQPPSKRTRSSPEPASYAVSPARTPPLHAALRHTSDATPPPSSPASSSSVVSSDLHGRPASPTVPVTPTRPIPTRGVAPRGRGTAAGRVAKTSLNCPHCPAAFPTAELLQEHKRSHGRSFACAIAGCAASFSKANHLSRHVRIVHNKERPFACDEPGCTSRFGSKSHLGDHKRAVHQRLRNFKCNICNASWSKRFNLEKHIRIRHLGEKPFRCGLCDMSFGTRSHVTRHELKVHKRGDPAAIAQDAPVVASPAPQPVAQTVPQQRAIAPVPLPLPLQAPLAPRQ